MINGTYYLRALYQIHAQGDETQETQRRLALLRACVRHHLVEVRDRSKSSHLWRWFDFFRSLGVQCTPLCHLLCNGFVGSRGMLRIWHRNVGSPSISVLYITFPTCRRYLTWSLFNSPSVLVSSVGNIQRKPSSATSLGVSLSGGGELGQRELNFLTILIRRWWRFVRCMREFYRLASLGLGRQCETSIWTSVRHRVKR